MATAFAPSDYDVPAPIGRGRPSTYSAEIGQLICDEIRDKGCGLRKALENNPSLPAYGTVVQWQDKIPIFAEQLARARDDRLDAMSDDIIDISDDDGLDPADKRIRVDTRKWLLAKLRHRTYGDKLDLTTGGETLQASSVNIDQRIQSIMMQAAARAGSGDAVGLSDEAQRLLE